ncbi:MAG TPA: phosphoglucomutase (alpha-D-glucose-1,6-bisphosphate-dependent) [Gemmatimonadaceae bacterium]|nr:phosphoglucomutase (alpha-D-glucose-1,6-bisphosphate-dependent) [Gemmatimonadaceae bacterium]
MNISPLAGHLPPAGMLLDVAKLITAYYTTRPDPAVEAERVKFGTSGHRGSAFERTFNEAHVVAISEAICRYRRSKGIDGPLFLGADTHALSTPACATAVEVLAANGVDIMLAEHDEYTPTPALSHAILCYNRGRTTGLADGIVMTPSHNPPDSGGFKYNPPNGGPADTDVTNVIEELANASMKAGLHSVKRVPYEHALRADTTHRHDYLNDYVRDLERVVDMDAIRGAKVRFAIDPLGGAGVHYWLPIAERYDLDLTVVSDVVDATFRFMSMDWDGQIRMDPSSPYAMQRLIALKDAYDIAVACDADHDRHGVVAASVGLVPSNHYLSVAIQHLFQHRPAWPGRAGVGKTVVSSAMIDRVAAMLGRELYEVPVGFKWFVDGLVEGSIGFCGEESAGATCLRRDGSVWTTDKDGIVLALLAAEVTAVADRDPGEIYAELTGALGEPVFGRVEAAVTPEQKKRLGKLSRQDVRCTELAGEKVVSIVTDAPGNHEPIGGVKVSTTSGWFAARPSGTENVYRIYAESFNGRGALNQILEQAQTTVDAALAALPVRSPTRDSS